MNKTAATDLTRSQYRFKGLKGLPHSLESPKYRGGEPVGLSNMVQFPAGSSTSS